MRAGEEAEPLNACALVSGGKDSFYSALLTKKQGHNIVALVNLSPHLDTGNLAVSPQNHYCIG